ncbi:MAG: PTS sugar transporter subunit IIB [bacterium]|nr:PTS sugar transporter subunit IIB [bacterium]
MNKELLITRIDDRLIHGQVVVGWGRILGIQLYIVVNDKVAKDKIQQNLMSIAVPADAKTLIFSIEEAIKRLKGIVKNKKVILLFSTPVDVLKVVEGGVEIFAINVGGIRQAEGRRELLPTVALSNEETEVFKKLSNMGVKIEYRLLPGDEKINFMKVLRNGKFI